MISFDHGLGDAAMFTAVLKHLRAYRPDHRLHMLTLIGCSSAFSPYVDGTIIEVAKPDFWGAKDAEFSNWEHAMHIDWPENHGESWGFPCTKTVRALREVFQIDPDPKLLNYHVPVDPERVAPWREYLESIAGSQGDRFRAVAIHYEGNTSIGAKNLDERVVANLCAALIDRQYTPLILDWDNRSSLVDQKTIFNHGVFEGDLWGNVGTGDASSLATLLSQCALMVGIDSGPLHVAGGCDVPAVGVWHGQSMINFFDLCPNVLHLVPQNYAQEWGWGSGRDRSARFMEDNYRLNYFSEYQDGLTPLVLDELDRLEGTPMNREVIDVGGIQVRRSCKEQDMVIVNDILRGDAYRTAIIPGIVEQAQLIVDVGAHIGTFSTLVRRTNREANIFAAEVSSENFGILQANHGQDPRVELFHGAVTNVADELFLLNAVMPDGRGASTGGSVVVPRARLGNYDNYRQPGYEYRVDERPIKKATLRDVLDRYDVGVIGLLKLDCEGSEFDILDDFEWVRKHVRFIVGEYHDATRWSRLLGNEYREWDYGDMGRNLFHLRNPSLT